MNDPTMPWHDPLFRALIGVFLCFLVLVVIQLIDEWPEKRK
jgi:hypothetical protein